MSSRFYVGTRKGLFTFEKGNSGWSQTGADFLGVPVPMLLSDHRNNALFIAAEHEHFGTKLHRSKDGGKTWDELEPPVYPEKPDDAPLIVDPWRKVEVPWSLKKVWSMETGGNSDGELWCGTIPGGLFRSTDHGESWELNESLWNRPERSKWSGGGYDFPGIHSICVHPEDPEKIALGISCGGVWRTADGGKSWTQNAHGMVYDFIPEEQGAAEPDSQDPHCMVQCRKSPERFWVQHHCAIYRSDNGAESWTEVKDVSPSGFGFAVAVHPEDPDTAWFVPAKKDEMRYPVDGKFVINRTRDGGNTFETISKGLPEGPSYDLVYRHALVVGEDGTTLVTGSTTGSLWVSEDGGDSWAHLTAHLPPVYCVKFG
ncbi:MAG: hypothetical protein P1V20_12270 [Verrucomicrobiales bacterium]|nr:hypothetical protein [Verrucomicrobiales bacterium]